MKLVMRMIEQQGTRGRASDGSTEEDNTNTSTDRRRCLLGKNKETAIVRTYSMTYCVAPSKRAYLTLHFYYTANEA